MNRKLSSLSRKSLFRSPKQKIKVFTEGKNTEPTYFNALNRFYNGALLELEIVGGAGTPKTIAEATIADKKKLDKLKAKLKATQSFIIKDEIWVAFDRDEHPYVPESIKICEDAGVGIAFSNPCFELWLILHYEDFDKPDDRHQIQRRLENLCANYDRNKGKNVNCIELIAHVEEAENRAHRQIERRNQENNNLGPPSTTVFRLTKLLRQATEKYKPN